METRWKSNDFDELYPASRREIFLPKLVDKTEK